ncbi:sugar phosphate isomerase/epimerase [Catalinimonas sp. 4WD22]|uniref:sugar phosphate isomerase/epimerase family protein n=1 Tax=Catalinimonas locisalis TaxID=3133978 RepID=UPI0031017B96
MFKLGFVSAILANKSFEKVVDFASENYFACVEMMCWPLGKAERRYAGVTHINVDELDDAQLAHIKQYLKKKNVFISGLGYYPNPLDADEGKAMHEISHIKKVIRAAAKLDVGVVNTFVGRNPKLSIDDNFKIFEERFPSVIEEAELHQVKIGIENCPMFFTGDEWPGGKNLAMSPAIWRRMFDLFPSKYFGLNYDPSHLVWMQMDEVQPLFEFRDRIHHVHLKDVKVYRDKLNDVGILATPLEFHSPKLPGLGDVRWSDFFSALTTIGYRGPTCIEVEDRSFESSDEMVKTSILQSRNFLSQFMVL